MCLAQGSQRSNASEARTCGPSVLSQALYHWATALPVCCCCSGDWCLRFKWCTPLYAFSYLFWFVTSESAAMVMSRWSGSVQLNHTFSLASLAKPLPSNWQQPFLNQQKEENDHRNYFMIKLHKSMGPGGDQTHVPWICSCRRYRLHSTAWILGL